MNTFRKLVLALAAGLFLSSAGVMAAEKHDCKTGEHFDTVKKECVKN